MTSYARPIAALVTTTVVALGPVSAARADQLNVSTPDLAPADCSAIQVSSREAETAVAEETLTPGAGPLRISPGGNGGLWMVGSDGPAFAIRACKFAMGRDRQEAEARLGEIQIENAGGQVAARGPSSSVWTVFFIVNTPRGASVNGETRNGPITIRDVDATVVAKAMNGPISIRNSRGHLEAETVNGPIAIEEVAGDVKAVAQNGPLTVKLRGSEWEGEGLDGRTQNGPLSVSLPSGYRSGVVVEAEGRSPFSCHGCADAQRTWDEDARRVQLGSGPERVRLRTTNGPVTVKQ